MNPARSSSVFPAQRSDHADRWDAPPAVRPLQDSNLRTRLRRPVTHLGAIAVLTLQFGGLLANCCLSVVPRIFRDLVRVDPECSSARTTGAVTDLNARAS
jgi:hypothetical protein